MADRAPQGLVVWTLDSQACSLPVGAVERVLPALVPEPVADAPDTVLGVVVLQGRLVPVLDLRRCLGLPARELRLDDSLVLINNAGERIAFFADALQGVMRPDQARSAQVRQLPDLASLLSPDDRQRLAGALAAHPIAREAGASEQTSA